jgi:prevent-host-death family protein
MGAGEAMGPATKETVEVTAGEISRNFSFWQDRAMSGPVVVTRHGKPRVVLVSVETYETGPSVLESPGSNLDSRHALSALLSHMIEGFVAFDGELRVTAVNRAFEDMLGCTEAEVLGRTLQESFPNHQRLFTDFLRRTLKTGDVSELEFPSVRSPGRVYRSRAFPYRDGVAAALQSRQDDYDAQRQISVLQAQVDAAQQLPGVSWASLSLRGAFDELSERFCALVGLTAADLIATPFTQLFKPASRGAVSLAIEACVNEGTTHTADAIMFAKGLGEAAVTIAFAPIIDAAAVSGLRVALAARS